jgi:hypothetical protein
MAKILVTMFFLMLSKGVLACLCIPVAGFEESVKKEYLSSSLVVLALANSIEELKPITTYQSKGPPLIEYTWNRTKFTPLKIWRGERKESFYTELEVGLGSCWGKYSVGKVYILFLIETDSPGVFTMSGCSFSKEYTDENDELIKLLNSIHLTSRSSSLRASRSTGLAQPGLLRSLPPVGLAA